MNCPHCGREQPKGAKVCIKCGASLLPGQPARAKSARGRFLLITTAAVVFLGIIALGVWLLGRQMDWWARLEGTPAAELQTLEASPLASTTTSPMPGAGDVETHSTDIAVTLPPPLARVEFPNQNIAYPSDWPAELHYPEEFSLVETSSGLLVDGSQGWAAKLLYQGESADAADLLVPFFADRDWQVVERADLDAGGLLLLLQQEGKENSGALLLDPDSNDPSITRVLATILP